MAHYNRIKTQKIVPVGTIMPWTGTSAIGEEPDSIPRGWIICNAGAKGLNAADYPILASIVGNEYGTGVLITTVDGYSFANNTTATQTADLGITVDNGACGCQTPTFSFS